MSNEKTHPPARRPIPVNEGTPRADYLYQRAGPGQAQARPSWMDGADESAAVDDARQVYPTLQLVHGKPAAKGTPAWWGGLFLPTDSGVRVDEGNVWADYTLITEEGTEIPGKLATDAELAYIRERRSWQVRPERGHGAFRRFPWGAPGSYDAAKDYAEDCGTRATSAVQVLVRARGLADLVVLSLKGTATMGVTERGGWLPDFRQRVLEPANMQRSAYAARRNLPQPPKIHPMLFWCHVGVDTAGELGEPVFYTVGTGDKTKRVTRLVLVDPKGRANDPQPYYVGKEAQAQHALDWHAAAGWAEEWKVAQVDPVPATAAAKTAPAYAGDDYADPF